MAVSLLGLRGVDGGSLVGDISDESVLVISSVGGGLDSAVRKSNHEATGDNTSGVLGLGLLEVGLAVVISHSVLVGERLGGELLLLVNWSSVVSWGRSVSWGGVSHHGGEESGGYEELEVRDLTGGNLDS